MSRSLVEVRELVGWGLDGNAYRDLALCQSEKEPAKSFLCAERVLTEQASYTTSEALMPTETALIQPLLSVHASRPDLQREYDGLDWSLGVIDLTSLLAFQRRLVFDPELQPRHCPRQDDWPSLLSLALDSPRDTGYTLTAYQEAGRHREFCLRSHNPDLHVQPIPGAQERGVFPFSLHGGSPFFEVAELRGRWFLRDGYHRAYRLLRAGVRHMPAVIIHARSINEVGATHPWFFTEEQLFSSHPPRVTHFLEDDLVFRYKRPRLIKTIHIRVEELMEPEGEHELQGENR